MSKAESLRGTNPFQPLVEPPVNTVTDYSKDGDKFIIEYSEIERVKITGEKDTDFVINKDVVETSRINRQEYVDSFRDDVGILNIIEKVRLSGDATLLNQTGRVTLPGVDKDALGRPVEDIADYTKYQVDKIEALESYKKGVASANVLKNTEQFNGMDFKELAQLKDEELDKILAAVKAQIVASKSKEGEEK